MNALAHGLAPKMQPISPKRSATVAASNAFHRIAQLNDILASRG